MEFIGASNNPPEASLSVTDNQSSCCTPPGSNVRSACTPTLSLLIDNTPPIVPSNCSVPVTVCSEEVENVKVSGTKVILDRVANVVSTSPVIP